MGVRRDSYGNFPQTGSTSGAAGTTEVIVANEAAASAIVGLIDGQQVFVKSHRSWWRFNANSLAPLVPHVVIASASVGASPRLLRTAYAAPEWRESITDVYIDPSNVTGIANDENQAIFSAPQVGAARRPLLTYQELFRRWGTRNVINTGDLVNLTFQIHILSNHPAATEANDPAVFDWINFVDTYPRILGEANVVVLAGVLDAVGGFTAQNPAANGDAQIKVGAQVWAAFLGKRIRFTATGAVATILKDLGGGSARVSQPQLTNEALFFVTPTSSNPANGAAFVVEDLVTINIGQHFYQGFEGSAFAFAGQTNLADVNVIQAGGGAGDFPFKPIVVDQSLLVLYQCSSDRAMTQNCNMNHNGCTLRQSYLAIGTEGGGAFWGGAIIPPANGFVIVSGSDEQSFGGPLDYSLYIQGAGATLRGGSSCGLFSVWDTPVQVQFNPSGHAVQIGGAPNLPAMPGYVSIRNGPVWGTGAVGRGMRVASGSSADWRVIPTITGVADFQLADDTSAIPVYDTPSYVYSRVTDAQVVGNATDVGLQAATSGNLVIAANTIALVAGKTYRLRFEARGDTTTLGETLDFAWVDAGTNAELIANTGRGQISNVATNAAESYGVAEIIYKPAANQTVKVRCINAVIGGTTTLRQITGRVEAESLFEFPIVCSWANLAATVAAGGFGGSAHNPRQNSHFVQGAAS